MYYSRTKEIRLNLTDSEFVCKRWRCMRNAHLHLQVTQRKINLCYFGDMKRKKKSSVQLPGD